MADEQQPTPPPQQQTTRPPAPESASSQAIIALVLGIVGFIFCQPIGIAAWILGIITTALFALFLILAVIISIFDIALNLPLRGLKR